MSPPGNGEASAPLKHQAALGDGRSVALLTPDGSVDWLCVPNLDSPPLFSRLIDPAGGFFQICPSEPYEVARRYRHDSNVLETTYTTATGSVRLTEALNSTLAGRLPWCELARRMEGLTGSVTLALRVVFGTRADTVSPWLQANPNGCVFHVGPTLGLLRVSANVRMLSEEDRTILAEVTLAAGERAVAALIAGENEPLAAASTPEDIDARLDMTDEAWRLWARGLRYDGPRRDAIVRSALALKLLLFSPSGAVAAAATTSLPERIGGDKNFDYRYAWVRDATYTASAFLRLGILPESKAAFTWIVHRLGETGARVCYALDGGTVPPVKQLDVAGYAGSQPVVTGNLAADQHQHGIYGDIFEMAALFVGGGNVLDGQTATILSALADECADRWRQKDSGIWELPERQHYTMSKISAWQALARAVEMAENHHLPATCVPRWARERDRIAAWVEEHCWSPTKRAYTFYAGTERLDASLVLAARFGFDGQERFSQTCDAIRAELGRGPFLYRYSGAAEEEGAFVACSFWLAEAYATLGRRDEAAALIDETLAGLSGGVGIFSEMVDVDTGAFLGNLPQGLSHLALIHAVCSLDIDPARPFPAGA